MRNRVNARENYESSLVKVGYIPLNEATPEVWAKLGFMSGLEVHQQLKTREKLFCRCPAGHYNEFDDYDAEIVRHMRPTLSELGEYDGTALMEFKTRKEIIYRIKNATACTYEIDDTPPFPLNREALAYALEIALLTKLNIVGELHITRKQYLDGSIPTGFQRTGIIGIEGEFPISNKKIRVIQLSLEEDSCREVSDIGHRRVYCTDRLGMPLIETVTYPDMKTPWEVREAAHYIRFLSRSSGRVRVGIGAGREDVNVSVTGGTRIEIKGVAHIAWIPRLTHIEAFRQYALLMIRDELSRRFPEPAEWKSNWKVILPDQEMLDHPHISKVLEANGRIVIMNLPGFAGILSHFTQPGKTFTDELTDRLKVIACVERPNLFTSEDFENTLSDGFWSRAAKILGVSESDAIVMIPCFEADVKTAVETVIERCQLAFKGVPNETRKSFANGNTIFERVLPGADRMYPDTDTAPIGIPGELIEQCRANLPVDLPERLARLHEWGIPEDAFTYILRNNLMPLLEKMVAELPWSEVFICTVFAHLLKYIEGRYGQSPAFNFDKVRDLLVEINKRNMDPDIIKSMLPVLYQHPNMDFDSILAVIHYERISEEAITGMIQPLYMIFHDICDTQRPDAASDWIMGNLRKIALGNIRMELLRCAVDEVASQGEAS